MRSKTPAGWSSPPRGKTDSTRDVHREGTKSAKFHQFDPLSNRVIGLMLEVHRELGPGLLESAYQTCLAHELKTAGITHAAEVPLPVRYKRRALVCAYRMDFVVEQSLIIELKSVDSLLPIYEAQLLTYLRLAGLKIGLLANFNVPLLRQGLKRLVL